MLSPRPIAIKGWINITDINDGVLKLVGWVISPVDYPLTGFEIKISGQKITVFDLEKNLPSPKLQAAFPHIPAAQNARFRLTIPLNTLVTPDLKDTLVEIVPKLDTKDGQSLLTIINPSLPLPNKEDMHMIGGAFLPVGLEFLSYLIHYAHLKLTDHVLDVGCGVGRLAYVLAYYLKPTAHYAGFDIIDNLIQWTQANITPQFPNFQFQKVNIHNKWYNPEGDIEAKDFIFPYPDASFDVIFLTSVFTHVRGYEISHYLDEIKRVLKPGGRCLFTCFLLNEESQSLIKDGKSTQNLIYDLGDCITSNQEKPENATGFLEPVVASLIGDRGFSLLSKHYGSWCGRKDFTTYQDMLVILKPNFFQKAIRKVNYLWNNFQNK
jgi:SAM-dependent methyltransferase